MLAEIAATNPAAIHTFFCRRRRQVRQGLAGAGLKKSTPPYDADFLSDGTLEAQDADGLLTALHYANALGTPRETSFRLVYAKACKMHPGVYAVQGYRAAQLLGVGLAAVKQR